MQTEAFEALRGVYPFRADFYVPARGWEKVLWTEASNSPATVFRPRLAVENWVALNAAFITELDVSTRHVDDGRSVQIFYRS